jgi:nitrate/nitrite-specific signal transduction histidine kinase
MALGLSEAGRVLHCSVGAILLLTPQRDRLELVARRGDLELAESSSISLSEGWPAHIIQTGQPFISNYFENETTRSRPVLRHSKVPIRSCLYVPIMSNSEIFGVIIIASEEAEQYKPEDLDFLNGLAGLLALALVSTQFYAERERAAGIEERNRIARDLHDGLAQSINYIGLKTQLVQELYQAGETEAVLDEIERISRAAELARMDVREVLYGLRHTGRDRSLTSVLADLVRSTADLSGIKVHLSVTPTQDWPALSLSAHIQLMRIVQEALSNIQKHSRASEAWVEAVYYGQPDRIKLRVADNGIGFEPEQVHSSGSRHLGLTIMRERATRSGASLKIESWLGKGTEVTVEYSLNNRLGTAELAATNSVPV